MAKDKTARVKKSKVQKSKRPASPKSTPHAMSRSASVWPTERGVLFRPERMKYVRKIDRPAGCVFCASLERGVSVDGLLVFKGQHASVILNKYPYNPGHLLIVPNRHTGDFLDLSEPELREIFLLQQHSVRVLQESQVSDKFKSEKIPAFNMGLNLGSESGAGIPDHLHYHVVPRWTGDTNFFPLLGKTKVVVETLEQTFQRLLPYFAGLNL